MLIVPGLAINNNINIECLLVVVHVTSQPPQVNVSDPVYLRVQGIVNCTPSCACTMLKVIPHIVGKLGSVQMYN